MENNTFWGNLLALQAPRLWFSMWAHVTIFRRLANLRKATISFVTSVRPSARMEQLGSQWMDFLEILYLRVFRK